MINLIKVKSRDEGQLNAHDLLKSLVDKNTLLALSGGTSMDYKKMVIDPGDISPGVVCVVDERYGKRQFHENSNELLMRESGLLNYLKSRSIPFHNVQFEDDLEESASVYNDLMQNLFEKFQKRVGVMGVGTNLHTAGIFPESRAAHSANYVEGEIVDDKFGQRITITLKTLGEFTSLIVMMFGSAKQNALKILLDEGENDMQKYPAIFYRKALVKVQLITDIAI